MGASPAYQSLYNQVHNLELTVRDSLSKPNDPRARELRAEMFELHEDFEKNKSPRNLEARIKSIQHILWAARSDTNAIMDNLKADHFYHVFEDMRNVIRKMPNF